MLHVAVCCNTACCSVFLTLKSALCSVLQCLQCVFGIQVHVVQCVAVSAVCVWHPSSRCAVCCSVLQCVSDFRVGIVQAVGIPTMAASGIRYETEVILTFYIPLCDVSPSCV